MIKRPLNPRFITPVLDDKKTTTIRDKAWTVGVSSAAEMDDWFRLKVKRGRTLTKTLMLFRRANNKVSHEAEKL